MLAMQYIVQAHISAEVPKSPQDTLGLNLGLFVRQPLMVQEMVARIADNAMSSANTEGMRAALAFMKQDDWSPKRILSADALMVLGEQQAKQQEDQKKEEHLQAQQAKLIKKQEEEQK